MGGGGKTEKGCAFVVALLLLLLIVGFVVVVVSDGDGDVEEDVLALVLALEELVVVVVEVMRALKADVAAVGRRVLVMGVVGGEVGEGEMELLVGDSACCC